jgi:hypothetical protein
MQREARRTLNEKGSSLGPLQRALSHEQVVASPVSLTDVVENVQGAFSPDSRGHVYFVRRLALAHETGVAVGALACTRALCPSAPLDSEYVDALSRAHGRAG